MYPLMIDIKDKKVVIVGGGNVATSRVYTLLPYEPCITVISPALDERLTSLYEERKIYYEKRPFQPTDVKDAFLVIAATNDQKINKQVKESCHKHQLYNIVDDPKGSTFHFPAMHRRHGITVAVATSGISPTLAKHLRDEFAHIIDKFDEQYLHFLQDVRNLVKQKELQPPKKREILQQSLQNKFVQSEKERQAFIEFIEKL